MYDIVNSDMKIPENISEELQDFLSMCFHKTPEDRASSEALLRH